MSSIKTDKSFMVIDDHEGIANLVAYVISDLGYTTEYFTDPREGLKHFQKNPDKYIGIFTDIRMPFLTGIELIEKVREIDTAISITILTANRDIITKDKLTQLQITQLIEKPFDIDTIANAIEAMTGD